MNYMALPGLIKEPPKIGVNAYFENLCSRLGLTPDFLRRRVRKREVVKPRQMVMYCIRKRYPEYSLSDIARLLGGFDHTTVIHSIVTCKNLMHTDREYRNEVDKLMGV